MIVRSIFLCLIYVMVLPNFSCSERSLNDRISDLTNDQNSGGNNDSGNQNSNGNSNNNGSNDELGYPIANGTFLQPSLLRQWDDVKCQKEFNDLKALGMKYIVLAPNVRAASVGDTYKSIFPTNVEGVIFDESRDLVDFCLRNAEATGMKVFVGLNLNDAWWTTVKFDAGWLNGEMEIGNELAEELYNNYKNKYPESFYGWYWVWEIDNYAYDTKSKMDILGNAMNINFDFLNELTPEMPIMFCPFMNSAVSKSAVKYGDFWEYMFDILHLKDGDIFAPQDAVGSRKIKLNELDAFFKEMGRAVNKAKVNLIYWCDIETFDQRFYSTEPLLEFVEKMEIVKPYVSDFITFAFSHYYSRNVKREGFYNAYAHYFEYGEIPEQAEDIELPKNLTVTKSGANKPTLSWVNPEDFENICGYYIYRNDDLVTNIQPTKSPSFPVQYVDTDGLYVTGVKYRLIPYDFSGYEFDELEVEIK